MMLRLFAVWLMCVLSISADAAKMLIPMSAAEQTNHLKAYGVMYNALSRGIAVDWLLNYKGGSYGADYDEGIAAQCTARGVSFLKMSNTDYAAIVKKLTGPKGKGSMVKLEQAPKIAVYTPPGKKPWDDAVTLALTYAEIPFDKLYASEVLTGSLGHYDWLHLHHEDFTGQYGKFWRQFHDKEWYVAQQKEAEQLAKKNGYRKVAQMQLAVVKKISAFVAAGGHLFAMCSATDTYDIALAADGTDICDSLFDGDPMDADAQDKLNYSKCFAFTDFVLVKDPNIYEYSSIDNTEFRHLQEGNDSFALNSFAIETDLVPLMLTQNHTQMIKGFMGQTTAFRNEVLKPGVVVLAGNRAAGEARYIHGDHGKGTWTFYGGHDPEDYQHMVNDPVTDLALYPSSPGYRLILNNVLFAAARRNAQPVAVHEDVPATPAEKAIETMVQKVKLYPNESNTELIISMDEKIKEVTIADYAGKQILGKGFNASKVSIDMQDMKPGLYEVRVNGEYAGKVIKR